MGRRNEDGTVNSLLCSQPLSHSTERELALLALLPEESSLGARGGAREAAHRLYSFIPVLIKADEVLLSWTRGERFKEEDNNK